MMKSDNLEQPKITYNPKTARIRMKIKEVFGWECTMHDDALVKRYCVTAEGDLIMGLNLPGEGRKTGRPLWQRVIQRKYL